LTLKVLILNAVDTLFLLVLISVDMVLIIELTFTTLGEADNGSAEEQPLKE
jgi:hypothetical protein